MQVVEPNYDLDETALEAALIEFNIALRDGCPKRRALREAIAVYIALKEDK